MKLNIKLTSILLFLHLPSIGQAIPFWSQPSHLCPKTESISSLTEGIPAIRVPPNYPNKLAKKNIQGCVILSYALFEEKGNANKLVPKNIKAVVSTDSAFEREAIRSLKKWLFLAKTQPASSSNTYYNYFVFTLEHQ